MFIITFICIICAVYCDIPRVQVREGTLIGSKRETHNGFPYYEYLQVPYAKPPVGNLRFKSPQPPEPWEGERNATESNVNNVCLQLDVVSNTTRGSEDCLYLNIFTPIITSNKTNKKPVMVSIHAGGFILGNGIIKEANGPDYLIEHDVIVIFINYRLNVFGFFSLGIPEAAGNMGLKDQVMALKWIHDNIDNFGGDKNNVTIFGISAGGASVEYHMLSPLSKGLFNKAIIQSGSTLNHWAINYDIENISIVLARTLGFNESSNDKQRIYEFVLNANPIDLFKASLIVTNTATVKGLYFGFVPSIEKDFGNGDTFLCDCPYNSLGAGKFHKVPVMRGFCEFEGYLIETAEPGAIGELSENKNFMDFWNYELKPEDIIKYNTTFNNIYFNGLKNENKEQGAINFFGDFDIVSGVITSTKLMISHGIKPFVYEFAYDGNMNLLKIIFNITREGAAHADDTAYLLRVFDRSDVNITSSDKLTIARMSKMWTDFAKIGNPTPDTNDIIPIIWPTYNINSQNYLEINEDLKVRSFYEPVMMAVFESIYSKYRK